MCFMALLVDIACDVGVVSYFQQTDDVSLILFLAYEDCSMLMSKALP